MLWALGATRPRWSGRGKLTIVTFHRVLPPDDIAAAPLPGLCVTPTPKSDGSYPSGDRAALAIILVAARREREALAARGPLGREAVLGTHDLRKSAAQLRDPFALRLSA
jgi:hypothetical protein